MSPNQKQRFRCSDCRRTFIYKCPNTKRSNEKHWFDLWVKESYSVRQLCDLSGHSRSKLERIKNYWLDRLPKEQDDYSEYKYIIYDGTYFHKNGCLISLMDVKKRMIITTMYAHKEGGAIVAPWFKKLKDDGLNPRFVVMDGEQTVMKTIRAIWPQAKIQRCLYHIQREGMRWLRTYPKTAAGRALRALLSTLCNINTIKERNRFIRSYKAWLDTYRDSVRSLPSGNIAFKDLKRTIGLLNNALPDMFHYLKEPIIPGTTNALESFYSRLKADYRRHRGITQKHKIHYLKWYCGLKK